MKITELLSIYAAILSTIVFIWNIARATPRIKVKTVFGIEEVEGEQVSGAYISVQNPSSHTVHLANISLLYPYTEINFKDKLVHLFKYRRLPLNVGWCNSSLSYNKVEDKCPIALEPGQSHNVFVPQNVLERIFEESTKREIKAVVQDQLWRNKCSNTLDFPEIKKEA